MKQILNLVLLVMVLIATNHGVAEPTHGRLLTAISERPKAHEFELKDVDGNVHRLIDYRGKVVIVNFWATWCPPCRKEMPSMQRAWEQLEQEGIQLLAINVGEDENVVFAFTADYPVEFPLLIDESTDVIQRWPVRGLPTTLVVDPNGRIALRAVGAREWDDPRLLAQVRALKNR